MITHDYLHNHPHWSCPVVHVARKWIWLKSPRTAGTTIMRHNIPSGYITAGRGYHTDQYREWLDGIWDGDLEGYFVWTTVRNPYDRLASALSYFHISPARFGKDPWRCLRDSPSFKTHCLPQHWYYGPADTVLRFETLQADWRGIMDRVGSTVSDVAEMNSSTYGRGEYTLPGYRDWLTDQCREWASEYYARELAELSYRW